MDCKSCFEALPELLLADQAVAPDVLMHLAACPAYRQEFTSLRETLTMMDEWVAPEPTPFFDARLHARLRAAEAEAPEGVFSRFTNFLRYGTGRGLRPAMAGALGLAMLLGGGATATLLVHRSASAVVASPAVDDLRIYDNNAQAVQQMDLLDDNNGAPQS